MLSAAAQLGAHSLADGLEELEMNQMEQPQRDRVDTLAVKSGGSRVRAHQKRAKKAKK